MKSALIFNLPEEREDFELAQKGWAYKRVIDELHSWLRQLSKYENKKTVTIDQLKEKIIEPQNDYLD